MSDFSLPAYFLADLPSEATLTPAMVTEACQTLKRNRARYLEVRTTESRIALLSELSASWLNPGYRFRQMALEQGSVQGGFSRPTLEQGLDAFFQRVTSDNLHTLLEQDLGHPKRLDDLVSAPPERGANRAGIATAPELLVQAPPPAPPTAGLRTMTLGVLARAAQFVKCSSGTAWLPRLFAHSLYEAEPKLGACLEVCEWPAGRLDLDEALYQEADAVVASGSNELLAATRQQLPARVRWLGYRERLSFAFITGALLAERYAIATAERAAADITAWHQLGSLSPHVLYVEKSGGLPPQKFAELLADELARREESQPRRRLSPEAEAAIASRRSFYQVRAAHSPDTQHWCSRDSAAWTVVYEADPRFQISCLNQFIYVKGVEHLAEALQNAENVRDRVSTVGLAAPADRVKLLVKELARWGVARVCPLGQMQQPPLLWRQDGRPSLADLVAWTDWDMG